MSIGQWYVYGLHGLRLWIVPNYYFIITKGEFYKFTVMLEIQR